MAVKSNRKAEKAGRKEKMSEVVKNKDKAITPENWQLKIRRFVKNRKFILAVSVLLLGILLYLGKGLFVAALVNGKPVSRYEVVRQLENNAGKNVLDSLVSKQLILDDIRKSGISVSDQEIDEEINKIRESIKASNSTLEDELTRQNQSMSSLRESIYIQKAFEKKFDKDVQVIDDEAKKYFEDNKSYYPKDQKFEDIASQIKDQLKQNKINQKFNEWLTSLRQGAKIYYFVKY